jgi:hypothetical protein
MPTEPSSNINAQDEPQENERPDTDISDGVDTTIDSTPPYRKSPILGLPSPPDSLDSVEVDSNQDATTPPQARWKRIMMRFLARHRESLVRLSKSSILVAKVCCAFD